MLSILSKYLAHSSDLLRIEPRYLSGDMSMSSSVPLSLVSFISYPEFQGMQMVTQLMRKRKEKFRKISVIPIFIIGKLSLS